jgi:type VI secretion system protein ImpA
VAPDAPSGASLEYDPAYIALFEAAKGKPEQQMGSSVIPAQPPEWRNVEKSAASVFERTKDLRVAVLLVRARIQTAGAAGLFDGLAFVRALLERNWDTLHPQLDPEDDNDPAMRMNALAELANPETIVAAFRQAELASARGVGRVRVRDLERSVAPAPAASNGAEGAEAPAEEKHVAPDAVFAACDRATLEQTAAAANGAVEDLRALEAFVREKVGVERAPNLAKLSAVLQLVAKTLGARVAPAAEAAQGTGPDGAGADAPANGAGGPGLSGTVRSREDVRAALDGICAYYERFEPSSPIPLLLRRASRLVAGNFEDIVKDLLPDAMGAVENLRGKPPQ